MAFCECGYFATSSITQTLTCPLCARRNLVLCLADQGRYAWYLLHTEANPTPEWYEKVWMRQVPAHGCLCRWKFRQITSELPPDFSSLENFRIWAITVHNLVNRELGKPLWQGSTTDAASMSFAITPDAAN